MYNPGRLDYNPEWQPVLLKWHSNGEWALQTRHGMGTSHLAPCLLHLAAMQVPVYHGIPAQHAGPDGSADHLGRLTHCVALHGRTKTTTKATNAHLGVI